MKKSLQIAGAYIGLIVGAGFASGQEILQFFTSFGIFGMLGTLVATFLFAFLGMQITQLGSDLKTISHKEVLYQICGRHLGLIVDILVTFFLFGVSVVMIAASGSIFQQQFGMPSIVGSIIMTLLTIATLCLNIKKVIYVISSITPFLLLLIFIITGYSIFTSDASFSNLQMAAKDYEASAPNWLLGAFLYVSYNLAAGFAMLSVIGGAVDDRKTAGKGGFIGGIGLGLFILLINVGMFVNLDRLHGIEMPTLLIASEISPIVGDLMSLALLGMIFNTSVGMLYAFTARFISPKEKAFKPGVAFTGVLAFAASFIGFITLVSTVYPITGYLGFVLMITIFLSWLKKWKSKI
ncbi:hypothetical protein H1Z61_04910 [Bacillus aquiflavi]|uniref:Membrane protein YkvI n=1 Tax=Bacillus aquiflavi TaxID=2672567 RepID=A0A6B3VRE5_9BACI|nr:hypothetical protein [Bacillus aquiflavi]MBA4536503.1 hypothetical protein [Bacillus aquiflavi]NEY80870.1 hypothetical protein [Bacillus aquiflavi]UAC49594.1 hypothetical protein K6959_07235 [Bacillus aquiflavi]